MYSELLKRCRRTQAPASSFPTLAPAKGEIVPRVLAFAQAFLDLADNRFSEQAFTAFCQAFQETTILDSANCGHWSRH